MRTIKLREALQGEETVIVTQITLDGSEETQIHLHFPAMNVAPDFLSMAWTILEKDFFACYMDMSYSLGYQLGVRNCMVGDIIQFQGKTYVVAGTGFKEIDSKFLEPANRPRDWTWRF